MEVFTISLFVLWQVIQQTIWPKNPVLIVNNFTFQNGIAVTADLNAVFRNSIFWGDAGIVNNEVIVTKQGANPFTVLFEKNIYRVLNDPVNSTLTGNIKNQNPAFDTIDVNKRIFDFRITKNLSAPGINAGLLTGFLKDLDNNNRNVGLPDLGCYEKQWPAPSLRTSFVLVERTPKGKESGVDSKKI